MGLPVRMCSAPSSSMIAVPDAWQSPRMPGSLPSADDRVGQIRREGGSRVREVAPVEWHGDAGESPSGRRACPCPSTFRRHSPTGRPVLPAPRGPGEPARSRRRRRSTGRARSRNGSASGPAPQPLPVALSPRAGLRDVAERIGAGIAVGAGIPRSAAADGVHHDEDGAAQAVGFRGVSSASRMACQLSRSGAPIRPPSCSVGP